MKTIFHFRTFLMLFVATLLFSCASNYHGSASDRTGTNGATNGTGKIAR